MVVDNPSPSLLAPIRYALCIVGLFTLSGCLGSTYHLTEGELQRLASLAPPDRGQAVRVVQELSFADHEPGENVEVYTAAQFNGNLRPRTFTHVPGRGVIRVVDAVDVSEAGGRVRTSGPVTVGNGRGRPTVQVSGGSRSGRSTRASSSSGMDGQTVLAFAAAVVATAGVLAVAATEGSRFDGWLQMENGNLLHLYRNEPDGEYWLAVPVSGLDASLAEWADGGVVQAAPGVSEYLRAPLDRQGFTLSTHAMLSSAYSPLDVRRMVGGSRFGFGYFPLQHLGLMAVVDVQVARRILSTRFGGELQAFFPSIGLLSLGLYGEGGGLRVRAQDGDLNLAETRGYFGGGGVIQLELSTRLAFELRGGVWSTGREVFPTFGLGLAVY